MNVHMYVTQLKESMDGDDKLWTGDTIALSLLQDSIKDYQKELTESREKLGAVLHKFSNNIDPPKYFEYLLKHKIHASTSPELSKSSASVIVVPNKPYESLFGLSNGGALEYKPRREFTVDQITNIITNLCR